MIQFLIIFKFDHFKNFEKKKPNLIKPALKKIMSFNNIIDHSSYWSIDDLLAEEEKLNVKFNHGSYQNSGLDLNLPPKNDIEEGQTMELPIWLALALASGDVINIEIPRYYKEQFKKTLEADPNVVNLRDKSLYYYEVGLKIIDYLDSQVIPTLLSVFLTRIKEFANISFHLRIEDCSGLLRKMVNAEIRIFNYGRESALNYRTYKEKKRSEVGYDETFKKLKKIKSN